MSDIIFDVVKMESMKQSIEQMSKNHHIEILKILHNDTSIKLNENKSGVYINLSVLPQTILLEIEEYLEYIKKQESSLNSLEFQKQDFKKSFFSEKENKDIPTIHYSSSNLTTSV